MTKRTLRLTLDVAILVVVIMATYAANDFARGARWFPFYVGLAASVLAVGNLVSDIVRYRRDPQRDGQGTESATTQTAYWLAWMVSYFVSLAVVGGLVATPIWLLAFLGTQTRAGWKFTVTSVVAVSTVLYLLPLYLSIPIPPGIVW